MNFATAVLATLLVGACRHSPGAGRGVDMGASAAVAALRAPVCTTGGWSAPRDLSLDASRRAYVGSPSVVRVSGGTAFFGTSAVVWRFAGDTFTPPTSQFAGFLVRSAGRVVPIPRPTDSERTIGALPVALLSLQAVTDGQGRVHVLWGTAGDSAARVRGTPDTVWHAEFDGERWGSREIVLTSDNPRETFRWNGTSESVILGRDGDVYVAIPSREVIHVRQRRRGEWHGFEFPLGSFYTTLATDAQGGVVLGFSPAYFRDRAWDLTGVYVARSLGHDLRWTEPTRVATSSDASAQAPNDLHALVVDTALYLLWTSGHGIRLHVSADRGASWRALPILDVPGGIYSTDAAVDGGGVVRLVGTSGLGGGDLISAQWNGREWNAGMHLPFNPTATTSVDLVGEPRLEAVTQDSLYLTWMIMRPIEKSHLVPPEVPGLPVTMYSVYRVCPGGQRH